MGGYALEAVTGVNDSTQNLVTERFTLAGDLAAEQVAAAEIYLNSLSSLFSSATMPDTEISYDFQNISLESDLSSFRPEAPPDTDLMPKEITAPVIGTINAITVPTITIPNYTLAEPRNELEYDESVYASALQDALQASLEVFVKDGGTGLGLNVEEALWARARGRQELLNERIYDEAEEFFASRGYTLPPGALGGRLTEAMAEQTRADAQLNYEISIEQARLARAQSEYSLNAAITLEGQDKEQFNNVANRALDYAKAAVDVIFNLFDTKVRAYASKIEAAKAVAEAEKTKVDAAVAANSSIIDEYKANVDKYKAQVAAEISIVETVAKVYGYKITGYEADASVASLQLESQIKAYQAGIEQSSNQTSLTLKEAEMTIQSYLGALQLTADSIKASGNISAQIATAALSAVNASASLGAHASSSYGSSSNYSHSESDSESISETHYYDETAI